MEQCATSTEGNRSGVEWRTASLIKRERISARLSSLQTRVSSLLSGYSSAPCPPGGAGSWSLWSGRCWAKVKTAKRRPAIQAFLYYSIRDTYLFLTLSCGDLLKVPCSYISLTLTLSLSSGSSCYLSSWQTVTDFPWAQAFSWCSHTCPLPLTTTNHTTREDKSGGRATSCVF